MSVPENAPKGVPESVIESQIVFRRLLDAIARPGVLFSLPPPSEGSLGGPETVVLRALLDHEVSFAVVGEEAGEVERLRLATGAGLAPPERADFVLVTSGDSGGALGKMKRGTLEEPHLGATAIYRVRRLSAGGGLTLALSGPGVNGARTLGVEGLTASEAGEIRRSRELYPRGVDAYLVDDAGLVAGLPRSTGLEVISA